jgi:phosphoribosyl 1,2-cyclic phosphate phosphodiesterase
VTDQRDGFIRFIGTGAGDFYEEHQRDCDGEHCARARALGGENIRYASSLFVAPDILIDFHNIVVIRQRGVEPSAIRHLLITHGHFDHFQPTAILDMAESTGRQFTLYGSHGVVQALEFARMYAWNDETLAFDPREGAPLIATHVLQPGDTATVGDATVTAVLAHHMINKQRQVLEQEALNYVIERGGKTLFYGIDTCTVLPRTFEALSQFRFDILVLDGTFGWLEIDLKGTGHHNFPMVEETVNRFRSAGLLAEGAQAVASHISCHHVPPHDEIADKLAERGITLAYDGLELDL